MGEEVPNGAGPAIAEPRGAFVDTTFQPPIIQGVVAYVAPPPLSPAPTSQDSGSQSAQFIRSVDRPVGDRPGSRTA